MPKVAKKVAAKKTEEVEEIVPPSKMKKEVDLDGVEPVASDKDDDTESLPLLSEEGDELGDDAELDTEEINPFGDKWEE